MKKTIILFVIVAAHAATADVYVNNKNGSDSNSGKSADKAVKTLETAVKIMRKTSDLKLVFANTATPYYESLRFNNFNGTPQKPIIVEGNGAVISGLKEIPASKWKQAKDGIWYYPQKRYGALRPYLVIDGKRVPVKSFAKLKDYSHYWSRKGVFFKPHKDKSIKDYKIFATVLTSGFMVNNSSYITCRNLTCEYFSNDGFNIHGDSQGLFFQNITGRYNGDDGFSIHEDVGATVRGGEFYENDYGIQDVNAARSEYYGVVVTNNRRRGIHLLGGIHTIVNSVIKDNKWTQVQLESDYPKHLGFVKNNPHFNGTFYLKNLWISNGPAGISVQKEAAVTVANSIINNCKQGIIYKGKGPFHLYRSIVQNASKSVLDISGSNFHFDFNKYYPGKMVLNGKKYSATEFEKWKADSKSDASSTITKVEFTQKDYAKKGIYAKPPNGKKNISIGLKL